MKKTVQVFCVLVVLSMTMASADSRLLNLTLDQRVAFQKAIEEVYWSHTIWPAENPGPKPELKMVMSDSVIRKNTREYIRKSNSLDSISERRVTPRRIQAEMNRMARETQDPELLREIWSALNNDPYLIAECFARPVLVERFSHKKDLTGQQFSSERIADTASYNYYLPKIKGTVLNFHSGITAPMANTWTPITTTNAPAARAFHAGVWTGTYMIIWGGSPSFNDGKKYNPATNSWSAISSTGVPTARWGHSAVWTGTQMIIWGGRLGSTGAYTNTGGRYTLSTNSWSSTSTTAAPSVRAYQTAIWNGSQMVIWGGANSSTALSTGGRYTPSTNAWTATNTNGAPSGRQLHSVFPSTSQMIIWGGANFSAVPTNTGGRYIFSSNSWIATSQVGAPSARFGHSAIWNGQMIIWGGKGLGNVTTNTGGRYTVSTNTWTPMSVVGSPSARFRHSAIWTGSQMIVWGGATGSFTLNTGARYLPASDTWISMTTVGQPSPRYAHVAFWTGSKMIVWGGNTNFSTIVPTNTGGIYTP